MAETAFELRPTGAYSLAASIRFLEGFAPAAYKGGEPDLLRLSFIADGGEDVAGVLVRSQGDVVMGEMYGEADIETVEKQVTRILSLDVDGSGFAEVGERDPVVGKLQERFRVSVLFFSTRLTKRRRGRLLGIVSVSCKQRRSRAAWQRSWVPQSR